MHLEGSLIVCLRYKLMSQFSGETIEKKEVFFVLGALFMRILQGKRLRVLSSRSKAFLMSYKKFLLALLIS